MKHLLILLCITLLAAVAFAAEPGATWTVASADQVNAVAPEAEALYLDLHRSPEISLLEHQTAAKLAERMKALGYEVTTGVGGTGIVAVLKNGEGRTVLMRTELDALPLQEKTGLPFASTVTMKTLPASSCRPCTPAVTTCTCPPGTEPPG